MASAAVSTSLLAREVQAGDGVGGERGQDHREDRRDQRDADRVDQRPQEQRRPRSTVRVVLERDAPRGGTAAARRRSSPRLERQRQDPGDRDEAHSRISIDADDHADLASLALHQPSPEPAARSARNTLTKRNAISSTTRNSSTETPSRDRARLLIDLAVGQQRQRLGVLGAPGHDEDVVEDAERVEGAEQHGDHDRRLHVRQDHLAQPLPPRGAVDLAASTCPRGPAPGRRAAAAT